MKRIFLLILLSFFASFGCKEGKKTSAESTLSYTCPMHPQVVQDGPGICPICKMDLVPVSKGGAVNELMLSDAQVQLANIQTIRVGAGNFDASKMLNARLVVDPGNIEVVSSRFPGRIEQLYVREQGLQVRQGQALFRIFSEELQTLQQDFLLQVRQVAAFPGEKIYQDLKEAARNKLVLYGLSSAQINNLERGGKVDPLITVSARASGVVAELLVREGQYIAEGTPLMRLENFQNLWVEADLYPAEAADVRIGTAVRLSFPGLGGLEQQARISFIGPQVAQGTQVLAARAVVSNPGGRLQPGMQALMALPSAKFSGVVALPPDAVIREEKGSHVWVKTANNTFSSRLVTLGPEDFSSVVITSGLKSGDEVVVSGAYLLYSEMILKKGTDPLSTHKH